MAVFIERGDREIDSDSNGNSMRNVYVCISEWIYQENN